MVNTSLEYRKALYEDKRSFIPKVNILLSNGTVLDLSGNQIMQGGVKIDDGVSSPGSFDIGSAVIGKLTLNINNMQDEYSDYNFTDAVVTVFVGLQMEDRIEWLKKGVFSADDPTSTQSIITLECLDNMAKFDKQYDGKLSFPANLQAIVNYCCSKCGVILNTNQFDNYGYRIEKSPFGENPQVTYREIISYCAQIAGCYTRCNTDGRLELKWFDTSVFPALDDLDGGNLTDYSSGANIDGGNFTNYSSGDSVDGGEFTTKLPYHHIYSLSSLKIAVDDVVITGIRVTASGKEENGETKEGETVLSGEAGYILELPSNPFVEYGKASSVADYLYGKIGGMRFRPADAGCLGDPSIEAGDCAVITDRKGNSYHCYVTNLSYTMGGFESLSCDAEPPARKTSQRYSEITKAIVKAREETEKQISSYDTYVQQLNSLAMNALGYYETVKREDDGSTLTYLHDKPLMADSNIIYKKSIDGFFISRDGGKTYVNGLDKDGNAVLNVLAAIGISFDWASGGSLTLGGMNDKEGVLVLKDSSGNDIVTMNKAGLVVKNGEVPASIITGKLTADHVRGGLFELGGTNGVNGKLMLRNSSNAVVLDMNENGLSVYQGSISAGLIKVGKLSGIEVDVSGSLKASSQSGSTIREATLTSGDIIFRYNGNIVGDIGPGAQNYTGESLGKCMGIQANEMRIGPLGGAIVADPLNGTYPIYIDNKHSYRSRIGDPALCGNIHIDIPDPPSSGYYHGTKIIFNNLSSITPVLACGKYNNVVSFENVNFRVDGGFSVTGTKERLVKTNDFGEIGMNAYETSNPLFADYGSSTLNSEGIVYIFLEPKFLQTVDTKCHYKVFLSKNGEGELYCAEKFEEFFVVKGKPKLCFDWNIVACQNGYTDIRMRENPYEKSEVENIELLGNDFAKWTESEDYVRESELYLTEAKSQEDEYIMSMHSYLEKYESEVLG